MLKKFFDGLLTVLAFIVVVFASIPDLLPKKKKSA